MITKEEFERAFSQCSYQIIITPRNINCTLFDVHKVFILSITIENEDYTLPQARKVAYTALKHAALQRYYTETLEIFPNVNEH